MVTGLLGCISSPRPRLLFAFDLLSPFTNSLAIALGLDFASDLGLDSIEFSREKL